MTNIVKTNNQQLRLAPLSVGLLSTLRIALPMVPQSATNVEVIVTSGDTHNAYTATFDSTKNWWLCDIDASQFPTVGRQKYEVAYKIAGDQFWDGQGWIEIVKATTSGITPAPLPDPYRYVVVTVNGYGATEADGAVRIPKLNIGTEDPSETTGYIEGDQYFNRTSGEQWVLCSVTGTLTWVKCDSGVTSVNGKVGAVSLGANDVGAYTKAETDAALVGKLDKTDVVAPSASATAGKAADAKKVAEFVNSSINNLAAYYLTYNAHGDAFPTKAALDAATTFYNGGVAREPTKNDYLIVLADEEHTTALGVNPTTRYVYDGAQWAFQYVVNNTSLTQAQVDAINSGITALLVNWLAAFKGGDTSTTLASVLSELSNKLSKNGGQIIGDLLISGAHLEIIEAIYANRSIYKNGGRKLLFNFDSGRSGNIAVDADFSPTDPAPYVSALFNDTNTYLTGVIDARLPYPLYAVPSTGLLKDRALNTTSLASVTVPDNFTDLLIRASVASSLSVTMPSAITTKYGDTFPAAAGEYLITITKTGAAEAYVRTIKLEVVA